MKSRERKCGEKWGGIRKKGGIKKNRGGKENVCGKREKLE